VPIKADGDAFINRLSKRGKVFYVALVLIIAGAALVWAWSTLDRIGGDATAIPANPSP